MSCLKRLGILVATILALGGATAPAYAAQPVNTSITVTNDGEQNVYDSTIAVKFSKALSSSAAASVKAAITEQAASSQSAVKPMAAGPTGESLYYNHPYLFTDPDGTFSFQHACGKTTGPWGYHISNGLCDYAISTVVEPGMSWTRNGTRQGHMAAHDKECRYYFHGNFNPDKDYDHITYGDSFTFEADIDGDVGTAKINISGSFTSDGCANSLQCGGRG